MEPEKVARLIESAAADRKARDTVILDVRPLTSMTDFLVVCEGDTDRQIRSIVEHVEEEVRNAGVDVYHVEGLSDGTWVCVDFGDVLFHVLLPGERAYYRLEDLWSLPISKAVKAKSI